MQTGQPWAPCRGPVIRPRIREWMIISVISLCAVLIGSSEPKGIEYVLLDLRFALARSIEPPVPEIPAAIIVADSKSEEEIGQPFGSEWREYFPALLEVLRRAGARAVAWDLLFVADEPDYDARLRQSLIAGPPSVAGVSAGYPVTSRLSAAFDAFGWVTMSSFRSVPRRVYPHEEYAPIGAVAAVEALMVEDDVEDVRRAKALEQDSLEHFRWLDFSYDVRSVPAFSMVDVLEADDQRLSNDARTPLSVFRNRVVFVGTDIGSSDRHILPGGGMPTMSGVFAQAISFYSYLAPSPIVRLPALVGRLTAAPMALLAGLLLTSIRKRRRRWGVVVVSAGVLILPPALFVAYRLFLPWATYLAVAVSSFSTAAVLRIFKLGRRYRTSLGFDPELIARRDRSSGDSDGATERVAAVLCADVRDYTEYVTNHPAGTVQEVMQEYLGAMESVIDAHGGYVNKYVGDEIVAVFGYPLASDAIHTRAVAAALDMLEKLRELRGQWNARGVPPLHAIGIGVDAGPLRFSHIGGSRRVQFDIIGNATNGAHRLQELSKIHGRDLVLPSEVVEEQDLLQVVMYGSEPGPSPAVTFIGEAQVRGQGRRRLYGLIQPSVAEKGE